MKRTYFLILAFLPVILLAQSGKVGFFMDLCKFQDIPSKKTITEIYFSVDGTSIVNKKLEDGYYHASVIIDWSILELTDVDSQFVRGNKLVLDWPKGHWPSDTSESSIKKSLFYMQKLDLPAGEYLLQAIVEDQYSAVSTKTMAIYEFVVDEIKEGEFAFSDIKWIASELPRDGRITRDDFLPLVTNDAFINADSIVFLQEIYNIDRLINDKRFFIRSRIYKGDDLLYNYDKISPKTPLSINAHKQKFYIRDLKSNTYYLQVEVVNDKNIPIKTYRKKFFVYNSRIEMEMENFSRQTDIFNEYSEEQLDYYLKTLSYFATTQELNFISALKDYDQKKNYLYSFLEKRKNNPNQKVLNLWQGHLAALKYVNTNYKSALREGWETDRGRVFLQYGIPNDIQRFPAERGLVPYEKWYYDRLGVQTNVIFVFFDQDLASNEYPLLHSSKYGEISNPRWQSQLTDKGRVPGLIDYERETIPGVREYNDKIRRN